MKSKMSFFDPTLLKKNVSRFAPAWALLLVFQILTGPLALLRALPSLGSADLHRSLALDHLENAIDLGVPTAAFFALLFAGLVFMYLHGTRAAYMMHAFPMTRNCLFVTNALSGLLFYLVPSLLSTLLSQAVLLARGVPGCEGALWATLGLWILQYLLFYGLAVFTMHISGNSIIAVLSYGALNFIFAALPSLILLLVKQYFKGFDYDLPEEILRLAPFIGMLREGSVPLYLVYGAAGLVLLALAWLHYRYRQVERAGDPMAFGWARVAFRLLFTLCCALGLGWVLAAFFGLLEDGRNPVFLPYALLGCFLGWFGATMMLQRSVKVFRKGRVWLGFAACAAVLSLFVLGLKFDLLGVQKKVPEAARVESVELWTQGNYGEKGTDCIRLTQAADIETVRAYHQLAIEQGRNRNNDLFSDNYYGGGVHILYHLSDGSTLRRVYDGYFSGSAREIEALGELEALYHRPDIAEAWYREHLPESFWRVTLEGIEDWEIDADGTKNYGTRERICRDPKALRDAVLADARAGRLPVVNSLVRSRYSQENGGREEMPYLYLAFELSDNSGRFMGEYLQIPITDTAVETIALFE